MSAATRRLYGLLVHLAVPIAVAVVALRGLRDRGYWQGFPERFGFGAAPRTRPSLWLHAVSLGEVTAAAPLVRALLARYPQTPLVLTTATPTGRAQAQALFGAAVDVRFLPYDTAASIGRFLACIDPEIAVILETELWPNLFDGCARRAVPMLLASARISAKSANRYRRFAGLFAGMLGTVTVAAQTAADAERFMALGAEPRRTSVLGNVKFDIEVGPAVLEQGRRLRSETLGSRPAWVAGSTHAGEEEIVLDAHRIVLGNRPGTLLVLAPRHPNRFDAVAALLERRACRFVRRSAASAVPADAQVLLLDTVGELLDFYAAADVAFVGGSLVPVGGHNLLEPAAAGLPVLTGPSNFNARDVASLLLSRGGARTVHDAAEMGRTVGEFLADADARLRVGAIARATVAENRGSVARLLELIEATRRGQRPVPAGRP